MAGGGGGGGVGVQLIGSLQRKHKVGSFDLLGQTAQVQVVSLVLLSPAVDYILSESLVYKYQFSLAATVG